MKFDYGRLRALMRARNVTGIQLADAMDLRNATLSTKLTHGLPFTTLQICGACGLLGIPVSKVHLFFFQRSL